MLIGPQARARDPGQLLWCAFVFFVPLPCYFFNPVEYDLSAGKTEADNYNTFPDGGQPVCKRRNHKQKTNK